MADVVVTVPATRWDEWLAEGDCAGEAATGRRYEFTLYVSGVPRIQVGERVYIVARGRVRGYAPLVQLESGAGVIKLIRAGGAVAVTIPRRVIGFRGFRYVWWEREDERPFPEWRTA